MRVTDPLDPKTTYDSVRTVVKRYTALLGADVLACILDQVGDRPNLASPSVVVTILSLIHI